MDSRRPMVSVIMPVYNAERYLEAAIQSVLGQTYRDFELIILNDGSTDSSTKIIEKYAAEDPHIITAGSSDENRGYANRLNEGIDLASGKYIARMDADDISNKNRLRKQVVYLEHHLECSVLATRIKAIDANGDSLEDWRADKDNISFQEIKKSMPVENCIAHPSIMAVAATLRAYKYDVAQAPSEDYDLWLRLLSDGRQIHKLDEGLLAYRIHAESVSQVSIRQFSVEGKYVRAKSRFVAKRLKHSTFGLIEIKVAMSLIPQALQLCARKVTSAIFIRLSRMKSKQFINRFKKLLPKLFPKKKRIMFVVPWMTMGGADKVHLDLISHLHNNGSSVFVIATVPSKNEWRYRFEEYCDEIVIANEEVSRNKIPQFIVDYSKSHNIDTVITSNNSAGYLSAPGLRMVNPQIRIIDIIQGQGGKNEKGGWPLHSTPFDQYIDKRVAATSYIKDYLIKKCRISPNKITVIHNGVKINSGRIPSPAKEIRKIESKFIVLWSGRFNEEKHPELVVEIARITKPRNKNIHFFLIGDGVMKDELEKLAHKYGLGDVMTIAPRPYSDPRPYMAYSDVVLMTSEMEGLPIVILESFSLGVPVIASSVGGIPEIIKNNENGYLLGFNNDFPKQAANKLLYLSSRAELCRQMGHNGLETVRDDFSIKEMMRKYDQVIS